ncbi:hypothetical protein DH2020_047938 [Rehmannia glutinosa]|uniref:Uncharacterized protein n=1 Tax=Rehmannia glutinosa TaxID=99300 RepID=A0ABR0U7J8_REHGL
MLCFIRSLLFFLVTTCLLISSLPSTFSSPQTLQTSEKSSTERLFADNSSTEQQVDSNILVLAPRKTYRKDPLNGFKRYTGGWNISNHHYWASVGYTAVPFFVIAVIWFATFGLCLSLICLCYCCCRRETYGYSRIAYALSLIFLIFFTIVAIIGCIVLYTGQGKFHTSTINTLEYVVHQADATSENLRNVSEYLSAAKQINMIGQVSLPPNVQTDVDQMQTNLDSSANTLATKTEKNSKDIKNLIESVRLALIILSVAMLLLTFLGFGDTCVAMNQWVQNPTAHTALDDILPCVDKATAQDTLNKSKEVTSQLVNLINTVISNVSNINFAPNFVPLYYNQSGPLLPSLCNPFNPDLTDRACAPGEVDLTNATQVWSGYVCQTSPNGICVTTGRLNPTLYSQMAASVNLSYGLYEYGPFLVALEDCTFVQQTFLDIEATYCPGLRKYSERIYVGLVMVATAVMLSLVFWVIYGRERRHRVYTKEHMLKGEGEEGFEEEAQSLDMTENGAELEAETLISFSLANLLQPYQFGGQEDSSSPISSCSIHWASTIPNGFCNFGIMGNYSIKNDTAHIEMNLDDSTNDTTKFSSLNFHCSSAKSPWLRGAAEIDRRGDVDLSMENLTDGVGDGVLEKFRGVELHNGAERWKAGKTRVDDLLEDVAID